MYKFKGHVEPYVQTSRQHFTRMNNIAFLRQLYEMGKYDVLMNYRKFLEEFGEQGICFWCANLRVEGHCVWTNTMSTLYRN